MDLPSFSLPATVLGPVSAGTVAWRSRGALYLTVVVKAAFTLVPEGRMTVATPDLIAAREQADASGVGLRTAGDLAPYLGQPEIWLTGHAAVPPRYAQPSMHVQLAVVQDGVVRIDKQLDLDVASAAGKPPVVSIAGMGPIAADWPLRSRWLEGIDPRRLSGPLAEIPDALSWEYFQTSPLDQRLDALRGDEWLVLGGMVPTRPRLRTQLAAAWGVARLYRRSSAAPRAGEPVTLRADTLQVDVDRLRCSILWRGRVQIASEAELGSLRVVAGLEQPAQAAAWADPFAAEEATSRASAAESMSDTIWFNEAVFSTPEVAAKLAAVVSAPLKGPPRPHAAAEIPFAGTAAIPLEALQKIAEQAVIPFEKADASAPQATAARAPRVDPVRAEAPFSGTAAISLEALGKIAERAAIPFENPPAKVHPVPTPAASAPRAEIPFAGTTAITLEEIQKVVEKATLPFEKTTGAAARTLPSEAPMTPAAQPFSGTTAISEETLQRIADRALTPFDKSPAAFQPAVAPTLSGPRAEMPFLETIGLSYEALDRIAEQAVTPFEKASTSASQGLASQGPVRHVREPGTEMAFSGTTAITLEELEKVAERAATPFEAPRGGAEPPRGGADSQLEIFALAPPDLAPATETIRAPAAEVARPALLMDPECEDLVPGGMGAEFLAAMAMVEALG